MYELRGEYTGAPSFVAQIDSLMNQGYTKIIRTKGSILMKPGTRTT
jgi:ubiquitin thioesterase protein OTUB1